MSIVFTVQSEERVLCTSKRLIWEAVQWGWGGVGCRGQEIRIRVINNFCSVINPPRSISALSCHFYVLRAPLCWLLLIPNVHFLARECSINHFQSVLDVKYVMLDFCQALNMSFFCRSHVKTLQTLGNISTLMYQSTFPLNGILPFVLVISFHSFAERFVILM